MALTSKTRSKLSRDAALNVAAFEADRAMGGVGPAPPPLEADYHGFRANLAAIVRDFAASEELLTLSKVGNTPRARGLSPR